jgi:hypothetical protein
MKRRGITLHEIMNSEPTGPELEAVCWCGHTREQHGPHMVGGLYRDTACLICGKCDEWQLEFCTYREKINPPERSK